MENLIEIVSGFLLGLAVVTPIVLKLKSVLKVVGDMLLDLGNSLEDGKITKAEIQEIVEDAQAVLGLFKK